MRGMNAIQKLREDAAGLLPQGERSIYNRTQLEAILAEIDALVRERDEARRALAAWHANLEEPQEVDPADLQALIDATWKDDRLTVRMSARDLWRMASDHRGRNEE